VPEKYRSKANSAIRDERDKNNKYKAQFSLQARLEYKLDEEDDAIYWGIATDARTSPNFACGLSRGVDELYSSLPSAVYNEVVELRSSLPPAAYNREVEIAEYFTNETLTYF